MIVRILADWLLPIIGLVAASALLLYVPNKYKYRDYSYIVMAGLTSLLIAQLLSIVYQPHSERPFVAQGVKAGAAFINNPGFPSDHILLLTVVVLAVAVLVRKPKLTMVLAVGVVLVAAGRVLALVHTPLDVIGGAVCGLSGGLWYLKRSREHHVDG